MSGPETTSRRRNDLCHGAECCTETGVSLWTALFEFGRCRDKPDVTLVHSIVSLASFSRSLPSQPPPPRPPTHLLSHPPPAPSPPQPDNPSHDIRVVWMAVTLMPSADGIARIKRRQSVSRPLTRRNPQSFELVDPTFGRRLQDSGAFRKQKFVPGFETHYFIPINIPIFFE